MDVVNATFFILDDNKMIKIMLESRRNWCMLKSVRLISIYTADPVGRGVGSLDYWKRGGSNPVRDIYP
jgi:hypothetical protein